MPNHIHGILVITDRADKLIPSPGGIDVTRSGSRVSHTVGSIVRGFKAGVTSRIRDTGFSGVVWHRDYWEHVVRGYESLTEIRTYISNNPLKWDTDRFHDSRRPEGRM
jgi:REP element-mobilizing transposase RayT